MLLALGPHASQDPVLLYKMLRICRTGLGIRETGARYEADTAGGEVVAADTDSALYYLTLTLMDEVFLPSLSLLTSNCCLAEEIWSVLRHFPYEQVCNYTITLFVLEVMICSGTGCTTSGRATRSRRTRCCSATRPPC